MSPNAVDSKLTAPYRLYFWSNENSDAHKAPHVHVESSDGYAEFWLTPVGVKSPGSYNDQQLRNAQRMVEKYRQKCLESWREFNERR